MIIEVVKIKNGVPTVILCNGLRYVLDTKTQAKKKAAPN